MQGQGGSIFQCYVKLYTSFCSLLKREMSILTDTVPQLEASNLTYQRKKMAFVAHT